jgi:Holliday junction resolvase RusA-like endonuclease
MNKIIITIPFMSISVNWAFNWKVRRFKSDWYKDFENKMYKFFIEHWKTYEIIWNEWLTVKYTLYFPIYNKNWTKKIKDVANYEKCLTDCLCKHIKWLEDHKIKYISLWKIDSIKQFIEIDIQETERL